MSDQQLLTYSPNGVIVASVLNNDGHHRVCTILDVWSLDRVKDMDKRAEMGFTLSPNTFPCFKADDIIVVQNGSVIELGEVVHMRLFPAMAFTDNQARNYIFLRRPKDKKRIKQQQKRLRHAILVFTANQENLTVVELCEKLGVSQ